MANEIYPCALRDKYGERRWLLCRNGEVLAMMTEYELDKLLKAIAEEREGGERFETPKAPQ